MNPDFHPIVNGTYLLLAIQLLLLAGLQFFYSDKKQYALAFICMIMSMWFFRRFFWDIWHENPMLIILIGGYKEVFLGPLLFFHLRMKWKKIRTRTILIHLALPIVLYLRYIISRIFFPEFYESTKLIASWTLLVYLMLSYWFYIVLGSYELRNRLQPALVTKAYKRVRFFFYFFFAYHLIAITCSFLSQIAVKIYPDSEFWMYLNGTIIYNFHWYLQTPYLILISIFLIVYSLSETPYFKKLFTAKNILKEPISYKAIGPISERISEKFYKEKIFTNTDLTLERSLIELNISKKELSIYLAHNNYVNFSEFINTLRVNEFKRLIQDHKNTKYDLVSIAFMAGFKSKATFYRVFKQIEGVTPNQFIKSK